MQDTPALSIGRGYTAEEAAAILGISTRTLNERVREGHIKPIFHAGERRYSGYALAQLLGWPLTDDPRDYMPVSDSDREELPRLILDMLLENYHRRDDPGQRQANTRVGGKACQHRLSAVNAS